MSYLTWGPVEAAMGWVGATYAYKQLPEAFVQQRPVLAASLVGLGVGLVVLPVLGLMMKLASS